MITADRRVTTVYLGLVALTFAALIFASQCAHTALGVRGAAAGAAMIAVIKARFVAMDFMELRGTTAQRFVDAWLAMFTVAGLVLILR